MVLELALEEKDLAVLGMAGTHFSEPVPELAVLEGTWTPLDIALATVPELDLWIIQSPIILIATVHVIEL